MKTLVFLLAFILTIPALAIETRDLGVQPHTTSGDFKDILKWTWQGSYLQVKEPSSWIILAASVPLLTYLFIDDQRLTDNMITHEPSGLEKAVSNAGIAVNLQIIPLTTYAIGRARDDDKMINYSKELVAADVLAMLETNFISWVPVHKRPSPDNLTIWETAFRYESSFPSGHVLGYFVTAFKTFQYYGPIPAVLPFAAAILTCSERVKSDKHYMSDVVAGGIISLLASEGVRVANHYPNNYPLYKWIFEHEARVAYLQDHGDGTARRMAGITFTY